MRDARMPREDLPRFVEPMLARTGPPPTGGGWSLELKLDGCRGQLRVDRGGWTLRSRPGRSCGDAFPEFDELTEALRGRSALLDGEIVCLGDDGKPDFHAVRPRMLGREGRRAVFVAFDLLHLDGHSTRRLPLTRRRELLRDLLPERGACLWRLAPPAGHAQNIVRVVREAELEGVVAKKLDAPYDSGRSGAWLKHKLRRSETFGVSGWSPGGAHEPEAFHLIRLRPDGRPQPAGAAAFGLTREERDRIRERARPRLGRRSIHDVEPGVRVRVEYHGRRDGPVRDAVMRELLPDQPVMTAVNPATEFSFEK